MSFKYFDHSATTPLDERVIAAMSPYFSDIFGNASSIHSFGQKAAVAVDEARLNIANFFDCLPTEVIFTSGATEANNLAIKGLAQGLKIRGIEKPHFITSAVEHDAVIEPMNILERDGLIELTVLDVDSNGIVNISELKNAIKDNTVLVSIMYVNSEVGAAQPIKEIGELIKNINADRQNLWLKKSSGIRGEKPVKIYFHTDATQAVNFFDCNTSNLNIDLLSFSAHKIYGPKGIGALIVKSGVPIVALIHGGHHERNLRSGTLNVSGIVGMSAALNIIKEEQTSNNQKIAEVRDYLVDNVLKNISGVKLTTNTDQATPAHAHFLFSGAEGEAILMALDLEADIAVSTGSACASNTLGASKVLLAMGYKQEETHGAIRFSLGKKNTKEDIDELMKYLPSIIDKFRKMAPDLKAFEGKSFEVHNG
ncbi:MAG: cysteine desulfurase family protein [Patescibacteria group bacterium]|nr:cysteine desulfurase family protein [Patescibacteria group bacterium]